MTRVMRGKWKGELAQVIRVDDVHHSLTVRLVNQDIIVKVPARSCSASERVRAR